MNFMNITKKGYKKKHKINIENYLMKENIIKRKYTRNRYRDMSEEDKQKLRECKKTM